MREDFYAEYYAAETWHWWFRARRHIIGSLLRRHARIGSTLCKRRLKSAAPMVG